LVVAGFLLWLLAGVATSTLQTFAADPGLVRTFWEGGEQIDEIAVPGRPPMIPAYMAAVTVPVPSQAAGINALSGVPAFTWCYGCAPTSAGMIMGYYDGHGYGNIYTGPANGGVCPLDNEAAWGYTVYPKVTCGECPLVASHDGVDGRTTRGHVDDHWIDYSDVGADPFLANGWTRHGRDCTADFMGSNQSQFDSPDGNTWFYNYSDGSPLSNYTGCEPGRIDGCHGLRLFVESRGYRVTANFSQYIVGYRGNTRGFTFANYKSEIDSGRPVLIQLLGHTMVGFGYNDTGSVLYIHDTWDNEDHSMTWGGTYGGMQHFGVTVLRLAPAIGVLATDAAAAEPSDGGVLVFTRTGPTTYPLTVSFTVSGTATAGVDYTALGTSVTFAAGSATAIKTVDVLDDREVEDPETVEVTLASGVAYDLGPQTTATVTIRSDDWDEEGLVVGRTLGAVQNSLTAWLGMRLVVGAHPITVTELGRFHLAGNTATHELRLVDAASRTVVASASWNPAEGADGSFHYVPLAVPITLGANMEYYLASQELAGGDRWYNAATALSTTAAAGIRGTALSVDGMSWTLGSVAGRAFVPTDLRYRLADLMVPTISVAAAGSGAAEPASRGLCTFTRTGPTTSALTVHFTVSGTATEGLDYAVLGRSVSFAAGSANAVQGIAVLDDPEAELAETVVVTLAAGDGYAVGVPSAATVTIADNDFAVVSVVAMDAVAGERSDGGTFTFTRTGPTTSALTVGFTVGGTATAGTDYAGLGTTVNFAAGSATAIKTVSVFADAEFEGPETVTVTLAEVTEYRVGTPSVASVTIADELPVVNVTATDAAAGEPANEGVFAFTRTGPTASALTVYYSVGGTATAGVDYQALGTSVSFAVGSSTAVQSVIVLDDQAVEEAETVVLSLAEGSGYVVGPLGPARMTLADNEVAAAEQPLVIGRTLGGAQNTLTAWVGMRVRVGVTPLSVTELGRIYLRGNTASHELRLVHAVTKAVVASALWDPAQGLDGRFHYVRLAAPVTLDAGAEYYLVSREVAGGDRWCNGATSLSTTEVASVQGTVLSPDGVVWTTGSAAGRAFVPLDLKYAGSSGPLPVVSVVATDSAAAEPSDSGTFTFTRTGPTTRALTVDFTTGGSASTSLDYTPFGSSVTFAVGSPTAVRTVTVVNDATVEGAETVVVTLRAGAGYAVGEPATATVTIAGDEPLGSASALVAGMTLGTAQNSLSAWMGLRLKIGTQPLTVSDLGRIYLAGNVAAHELRVVQASSRITVASVVWHPTGGEDQTILYVPLAAPVTLEANTEYYLVSQEVSGGDRWFNAATKLTTTAVASVEGAALTTDGAAWVLGSIVGRAFGPVDLKYTVCVGGGSEQGSSTDVGARDDQAPRPVVQVRWMPVDGSGGWLLGTLLGEPGATSAVEYSGDLMTWTPVAGGPFCPGEHEVQVHGLEVTPTGFWRLRTKPGRPVGP
jgi:hypothetical protein